MSQMIYRWKPQARIPASAQSVGERIEAIDVRYGGVTPSVMVEDARPDDSPLHPCFEWVDSVAAQQHREDRARYLLRQIVVRMERGEGEEPRVIRAFVPVQADGEKDSTYRPILVVMQTPSLKAQALARARGELEAFRRRYAELEELADVFTAIDRMLLAVTV